MTFKVQDLDKILKLDFKSINNYSAFYDFFYNKYDVLFELIPELKEELYCQQPSPYHLFDVYHHSIFALCLVQNTDLQLRLAVLLHDIGKPKCVSYDEDGNWHTYNHAEIGSEIAYDILTRLEYEEEMCLNISKLIKLHQQPIVPLEHRHDTPEKMWNKYLKKFYVKCGKNLFPLEMELRKADILAHSPEVYMSSIYGLPMLVNYMKIARMFCDKDK